MEDKKLLSLLRKDPNAGMEQLIDQYAGLVYAVVKGRLDGFYYVSSDIEDCVADAFSNFYMNLSDYDPSIASIRSYLCVIARNHAINIAKRRSRYENVSYEDETSRLIADDVMIGGDLAEDAFRRDVIKAVEALGDPDASILFRKYYYGQSGKDIAKVLGLSESNVNTRTHRALQKIRKMFGGSEA
ncbi:MAG: sigma-70 family RNA polymerase sigma factor [Ruminococcaceae bacterium]|nr:sigma-70 family RNA polymerase sigma factor [Oscillospiraceae bacterium]